MNDKHIKASFNETKGQIKENVGHVIGNEKMESEGVVDQLKGKIERGLGDLKDKVKEGVDTLLHKNEKKSA